MKKFIYKALIFIFSGLVFAALPALLCSSKANFHFEKEGQLLILGHSHSACAYNDSLIENTINFSRSGESYFYTFAKLKKTLEQNPNIHTVFIEFGNNNIEPYMDTLWTTDTQYILEKFPGYAPFMKKETIGYLYDKNKSAVTKSILPFFQTGITMLIKKYNYTKVLGGYEKVEGTNLDSDTINKKQISNTIATENLLYLRKIIRYIKGLNKEVYLIRTPVHKYYPWLANEDHFKTVRNEMFSDLPFLDFSTVPLQDNAFADSGHLNYKGSKKLSIWLNHLLNKELLNKQNKKEFIENELRYF
ncbi:hypothetical protein NBRC110019_27710 [Neptunitalea chrysea]|uniref:SGNH hydrolase-type esterase domain-containing protein n=1 Tax=Neptunitalea chrysea TaxID=1647581 RepID=A0A9W6B8J6_9FLAO|nr:hypothetical protein [Neptunitalea chrysea]GLB53730.1 hypothetical protein NBRC110019_27710 [Neptunitalea chrysea]